MNDFSRSFSKLRRLVLTQRTTRLVVRAVWTALAGYLIAWGLAVRFDLLRSQAWPFVFAGVFALPWLIAIFRPLPIRRLAWRMDRILGLGEQMTTAWQVSQSEEPPNRMEEFLLRDAGRLVPDNKPRIQRRGWHLGRDLQGLGITLILLLAINFSGQIGAPQDLSSAASENLPALDQPPGFDDVFPSGIPGLTDASPADAAGSPGSGTNQPGEDELPALNNILSELGAELGQNPETADIGEALENGDLEAAAQALEQAADNVDQLPQDVREQMQEAFEGAAQQAEAAGQESLADDLQAAAQALENADPNSPLPADRLDELADEFRDLAEIFGAMGQPESADGRPPPENPPQTGSAGGASGSGSGQGVQGQPEPLTRLEGEGQDFTLEGGDTPSGLLQPGNSSGTDVTTSGGTIYLPADGAAPSTGTINSILTPYSFPWRWRYVVSEYFSP